MPETCPVTYICMHLGKIFRKRSSKSWPDGLTELPETVNFRKPRTSGNGKLPAGDSEEEFRKVSHRQLHGTAELLLFRQAFLNLIKS
jgi:hypothetical protein